MLAQSEGCAHEADAGERPPGSHDAGRCGTELKKPQYSISSQKTFVPGMKRILGKEHVAFDEPVLKDVASGTYVRYSHNRVVPPTSGGPAEQASINLEAACNQTAVLIVVQPGDVLVISNRLSLHGRGEVGDDVGGQSRWLAACLRARYIRAAHAKAPPRRPAGACPVPLAMPPATTLTATGRSRVSLRANEVGWSSVTVQG